MGKLRNAKREKCEWVICETGCEKGCDWSAEISAFRRLPNPNPDLNPLTLTHFASGFRNLPVRNFAFRIFADYQRPPHTNIQARPTQRRKTIIIHQRSGSGSEPMT